MKIVVATDSLKGSLTSMEAGNAIRKGIQNVIKDASVCVRPLADGGEGTVEALTAGMGGRLEKVTVTGPLGQPVACEYGIIERQRTAIIEMSGAAGITLIEEKDRNPLYTTTYGVGEVIRDAVQKECRHFIIGIGGSATNDGGIGMLQALGYDIQGEDGKPVMHGAKGLREVAKISDEHVLSELKECTFRIACDVTNPLCGEQGCSVVYGPQKGADAQMIRQMDQWMAQYAERCREYNPYADARYPGTGAAGGLGFAFLTFLHASLESGTQIVLEETGLEEAIRDCDIVVTGEGRLDGQTVMGKAPIGVAGIAKKYGKPVIAFAGCVTEDAAACNTHGIDAYFPIVRGVVSKPEAMQPEQARKNMTAAVEQVFRLIVSCRK